MSHSINTSSRIECVRLRDYLTSQQTVPQEQMIQEIFKQMATQQGEKIKLTDGPTFKKLKTEDYKALANAASKCLQLQPMTQNEVKQFHLAMDLAMAGTKPKNSVYFVEAEEMAKYRETAAESQPEDVFKVYNEHIEKLVNIKSRRAEELKKPIKRGKIIVGVVAAMGAVSGLLIGGGIGAGIAAVSFGAAIGVSMLLVPLAVFGLAFGLGSLAQHMVLAKPEKELKEIKTSLNELENEKKVLGQQDFLEFLKVNHITPNEVNIPICVQLYQEDKKLKYLEAEKDALTLRPNDTRDEFYTGNDGYRRKRTFNKADEIASKEKEIEVVKQKMSQLQTALK